MKEKIDSIHAHEILDSRGNPTLHVVVILNNGSTGNASVPSGASTGIHEALELRDGDPERYRGKGVLKAIKNVNMKIFQHIKGMDVMDLKAIDDEMRILDGTVNKHRLGANAILGVSMACAHAGARRRDIELYEHLRDLFAINEKTYKLPTPLMNIFNGGAHADTNLDMQEFIIIPHAFKKFSRQVQAGSEIFHALGDILKKDGLDTDVGNEGGYAPEVGQTEQALDYLVKAIRKAKYKPGGQVSLGIDVAASEFYDPKTKKYILKTDRLKLSAKEMTDLIAHWHRKYPLMSVEDPLDQDAWEDWVRLTARLGEKMMVIGDDFYVTNVERLQKGIDMGATNAVLIKMNQIGTISETMETIALAKENKQKVVVSHRSGETSDTTLADLAVAVNAEYVKTGAPSRSERLAKYNRLMEIEENLLLK
ncbi:phosphopyruvate hydratase [Patescibacteria group bacterium]|nr:phosphopyruvate hydratase [Patescibacteria group bacterium]